MPLKNVLTLFQLKSIRTTEKREVGGGGGGGGGRGEDEGEGEGGEGKRR